MTGLDGYELSEELRRLGQDVQAGRLDSTPDLKQRAQNLLNADQRQRDARPRRGVHDPWPTVERQPARSATVFASGDLPPFTASGVDPQMLRDLPPSVRRAVAAEPDAARVLRVVEYVARNSADDGGNYSMEGLDSSDLKLLSGGAEVWRS